jgi:phenylpropionate dioxygenase-like ring-hydroxylating dioxygenase large terminal subunit
MLTEQDNDLLTSVGPGTTGGEVIRSYWLPMLLSYELVADGAPLRVRLMGEDLIAFRSASGAVGLIQNACPHRGASLFFGRNEEEGLRCVYHGWKFDASGACTDMPSEPAESNFKTKVHARAYPCSERNGVIWTYMGSQSPAPPLPQFEWNTVPEAQSYVSKRVQHCNWFQALEGGIDSSHSNFIHAPLNPTPDQANGPRALFRIGSKSLHFETRETNYGVIVANRRPADEGNVYWRMNHYVMPFYTMFPPTGGRPETPISGHAWVPIDDDSTLVFHWSYSPTQPLNERQRESMLHGNNGLDGFHLSLESRLEPVTTPHGAWLPKQRAANDYMLDYEAQRTVRFSGVPGGWNQDAAVQESMGAVTDRRREHLGTSDMGIIAARRFFIATAKAYRNGVQPPAVNDPAAFSIRPAEAVVRVDADWFAELKRDAQEPQLAPLPVAR